MRRDATYLLLALLLILAGALLVAGCLSGGHTEQECRDKGLSFCQFAGCYNSTNQTCCGNKIEEINETHGKCCGGKVCLPGQGCCGGECYSTGECVVTRKVLGY